MTFLHQFMGALSPGNLRYLFAGYAVTLEVAAISIVLSFLIGLTIALVRYTKIPVLNSLFFLVVQLIRNLPLLLIIFFTYFALPEIHIKLSVMTAAILAVTIFESALLAEVIRAGLSSIEKGQIEAGRSSGLTSVQTIRYIVLPQALKRMIPPIVSQFISLLKDTSLAVVIALPELMHNSQVIYSQNVNFVIPIVMTAALLYFVPNYLLSLLAGRLEKRWGSNASGRKSTANWVAENTTGSVAVS